MTVTISGTTGVSLVSTNSVPTAAIQASAVTTAKIADANITTAKIADANVTQAKFETLCVPLAVGQTWTDVTASRAAATTYTNSTGRPIMVCISAMDTQQNLRFLVNGATFYSGLGRSTYYNAIAMASIIPNGATYQLPVASNGINSWLELR